MSDHPGSRPDDDHDRTQPLGWGQPEAPRGWDAPGSRPQSWDAPASGSSAPHDPWSTPAGGSAPYGQPTSYEQPTSPYGAPQGPWVPYGQPVTEHPQANLALVLGIIGLVGGLLCLVGFLLSPVAWAVGSSALKQIRTSGGHYGGESQARTGQVLGIVGTVLLALAVLVVAAVLLFVLAWSPSPDYSNV